MTQDSPHTGTSPICEICASSKQPPFCIGCFHLRKHDEEIRQIERKKVLDSLSKTIRENTLSNIDNIKSTKEFQDIAFFRGVRSSLNTITQVIESLRQHKEHEP